MTGREAIKLVMERLCLPNNVIAKRLGLTNATMWARVNQQNTRDIPVSQLVETLKVMDYKVVVLPSTARVPDNAIELD